VNQQTSFKSLISICFFALTTWSSTHTVSSMAEANNLTLSAGDTVVFTGGQTYSGALRPKRGTAGTAANPVVFTASGSEKAIISVSSGSALDFSGSGVTFHNLHFKGPWTTSMSGASSPDGVIISNGNDCKITHCEVSNFAAMGIHADGDRLRIEHTTVHDVGWDGINIEGGTDVYVGYCTVYEATGWAREPHSGSGILIAHVDGAIVEFCEVYECGKKFQASSGGGPVGIWSWDSDGVIVQYCESHHNANGNRGTDGGGFDIDGGDKNCIVQYCYSHDNEGPGYLIAHYKGARPTDNNTFRYCISENDCQDTWQGCISLWSANATSLTNTTFHNMVVYTEYRPAVARQSQVGAGNMVYNSIFITNKGAAFTQNPFAGLDFRNNCYWAMDGDFNYRRFEPVKTLTEFQDIVGEEIEGTTRLGMAADPQLLAPGQGGTIGDPEQMAEVLDAYKLKSGSPCIGKATDLHERYGLDAGANDFYGTSVPTGDGYDLGACEFNGPTKTNNPLNRELSKMDLLKSNSNHNNAEFFNMLGRHVITSKQHRAPSVYIKKTGTVREELSVDGF